MLQPGQKIILKIDDLSHDCAGVGRIENLVTFIPGALPDEKIEAEITEVRKNFSRARLLSVVEASPERINPLCLVYDSCGGCQLQHLNYRAQLNYKKCTVTHRKPGRCVSKSNFGNERTLALP